MLDQSTTHRYLIITYKVHVINYTESHQLNYLDSSKQEKLNMAQLLLTLIGKVSKHLQCLLITNLSVTCICFYFVQL